MSQAESATQGTEPAPAPIRYDVSDGVGWLHMARPKTLNAMTLAMLQQLISSLHEADADDRVHAIVITGHGKAFSSGWDRSSTGAPSDADAALQVDDAGRELMATLNDTRKPVVARLRGAVVGGAALLASACDLRLADTTAYFWLPEPGIGSPVFWSGVSPLVREIGYAQTRWLALSGRKQTAAWAAGVGLVHELHEDEDALDAAVANLTSSLTRTPGPGLSALKDELRQLAGAFPDQHPHSALTVLRSLTSPTFSSR